jgi:hypothetical protein
MFHAVCTKRLLLSMVGAVCALVFGVPQSSSTCTPLQGALAHSAAAAACRTRWSRALTLQYDCSTQQLQQHQHPITAFQEAPHSSSCERRSAGQRCLPTVHCDANPRKRHVLRYSRIASVPSSWHVQQAASQRHRDSRALEQPPLGKTSSLYRSWYPHGRSFGGHAQLACLQRQASFTLPAGKQQLLWRALLTRAVLHQPTAVRVTQQQQLAVKRCSVVCVLTIGPASSQRSTCCCTTAEPCQHSDVAYPTTGCCCV